MLSSQHGKEFTASQRISIFAGDLRPDKHVNVSCKFKA